jgi:hypothetical protein
MSEPSKSDREIARRIWHDAPGTTPVSELLAQAVAAGRADALAWQPIETAPKDGTEVDLWVNGTYSSWREVWVAWRHGEWRTARGPIKEGGIPTEWCRPTNWRPAGEPPVTTPESEAA